MQKIKSPEEIANVKGKAAKIKLGDKGGCLKCFLVSKFFTN